MEDDTLFSKGAVQYLMHKLKMYKNKPHFSHVALGSSEDGHPVTPKNLSDWKHEIEWCSMWGYAAPISMAYKILETTTPIYTSEDRENIKTDHSLVWDVSYCNEHFIGKNAYCITPIISRLQNIGVEGGLHSCGKTWQSWEGL
jgi:hypothetical protein